MKLHAKRRVTDLILQMRMGILLRRRGDRVRTVSTCGSACAISQSIRLCLFDVNSPHFTMYPSDKPASYPVRSSIFSLINHRKLVCGRSACILGGAIDAGAQKSVIGIQQARRYCEALNIKMRLTPTNSSFRFGSDGRTV